MAITQVITTLPTAPDPATDTRDEFSTKAAAYVLAQKAMVPELNTWAGQVNAIAATAVGDVATAIGAAAADTLVDADEFCWRKTATGILKKITWANIKATLGIIEGTWTPANTTGLTLYGGQNYTRNGNIVIAQFDVGWPSTADGGTATITGFPVNAKAVNFSCAIGYTTSGAAIYGRLNAGTLTFANASGVDYTNANLSLKEVVGTITYLT